MSHSTGMVRFTDGSLFYIEYNGTVDVCLSNLFDSKEERDAKWRSQEWKFCTCKPVVQEPCEIAVTYGGGWYWNGFACRTCKVITNRFEPHGHEDDEYDAEDGLPDWYPNKEIYKL